MTEAEGMRGAHDALALPARHRVWRGLCVVVMATVLGLRAAYFVWDQPPAFLADLLLTILIHDLNATFLLALLGLGVGLLSAPVLAVLLLMRPRRFLRREGRMWATAPWLLALIWTLLMGESWTLDLNLELAWLGLASLVAALALPAVRLAEIRTPRVALAAGAWALILLGGIVWMHDPVDRLAAATWALVLIGLAGLASRGAARDRAWIAVAALCALQLGASGLPLLLPLHGGTLLGPGMAHSFCESPERHRLFAAVPECAADLEDHRLHACQAGYVAEFDTRDLATRRELRFFDEDFYGRLEQIVCLGDQVQIGMERTLVDGSVRPEHVMAFDVDDPARVDRDPVGSRGGAHILSDPVSGDLYYVSAHQNRIHRLERATGRIERVLDDLFLPGGSTDGTVHEADRTLLILGRARRPVHAFSMPDLTELREYPQSTGLEVAVDEERHRLVVSGLFGIEVFDLRTGQRIARRRTGFVARRAAFDARHGLVYVPTYAEGKIRVYEQESLELVGKLPVGLYVLSPLVSADGSRLFAGNRGGHYHWSLSELARRYGAP